MSRNEEDTVYMRWLQKDGVDDHSPPAEETTSTNTVCESNVKARSRQPLTFYIGCDKHNTVYDLQILKHRDGWTLTS